MLTLYTAVGILRFQDSIKEHKTPTVINNRQEYGLTEEEFFLWSSLAFQIRQIHELQSAFSERLKKHHRSENIPIEPYLNRLLLRGLVVKGDGLTGVDTDIAPTIPSRFANAWIVASAVSIPKEDFVDKYILSNSRTLTPQEESTVPILEDWYVIPKEIQRICEHAKLTTDSKQPMRNFMLRGPAGTGKTEGAKAIAAGLHLPYRCITCSANTEIFDLLGQILPDVDEKQLSLVGELPSFQDITLDPATAYEKLTGTYDEKVSENTVYEELIHHISEEMKQKQAATSSSQQFRYVDTPLVEAIRNGYLVEIQEPTVIANPGVLVGLNSLLDRCNSVFLPNGEVIHRHPDTTIIVTTNHDYAGCRPMNQSVISRMNMVIDMDEPDEETMVERVLAITGCSDKKSVRTMTQIVRSIAQYCQDNLITDGCCGVRELIAWVQSFMVCGDIQEAAHYTILSSVTADSESRIEIEGSCLDTVLAS